MKNDKVGSFTWFTKMNEDKESEEIKDIENDQEETEDLLGQVSETEIAIKWVTKFLKEVNSAFPNKDYVNKLTFKDDIVELSILVGDKWADFSLIAEEDGEKTIKEIIEEMKKEVENLSSEGDDDIEDD